MSDRTPPWRFALLVLSVLAPTAVLGAVAAAGSDLRAACDADVHARVLAPWDAGIAAEARAVWLDARRLRWRGADAGGHLRLHHAQAVTLTIDAQGRVRGGDGVLELVDASTPLTAEHAAHFAWFGAGREAELGVADAARLRSLAAGQWLLTREDAEGRVLQSTQVQAAALFDALFADAAEPLAFDPEVGARWARLRLWAPSAQQVSLCLYPDARAPVRELVAMVRDEASGAWHARTKFERGVRPYYTFLVDVVVPGLGRVRNRVTDPYAFSLAADSGRAWLGALDDRATRPPRWRRSPRGPRAEAAVDQVIYELHVRDFSLADASVEPALRGKYLAFAQRDSDGMRHLRALAAAGVSDVHLLPVFDFATVPERGCVTPAVAAHADDPSAQAAIAAVSARDCYNWGYDPLHFGAPEGSYASDADDGALRIREFRTMVQALHDAGLRVGMDVVYNHMSASGQDAKSVLDRIVPGYYHRLDAEGRVTTSTCCANTATEQRMMAKLMIDSAVRWVRHYGIDAFRFDLMGHQPRAAMERLQRAVDAAAGRRVPLLGEGWNFGEVADGARFVQASQLSLAGSGIATFSDRARDAVRGGGPADHGERLLSQQGYVNGLHYDRNESADGTREDLLRAADMVRVGLAGSLRDYVLRDHRDRELALAQIVYGGNQPAGYVAEAGEVVNYVENHDNQTLFDINAFKLPRATARDERARVQMLAVAINLFSQGIAYFHAGVDLLRSKSLDRNSYDSGDWFNRIDWSAQDNHFAAGLPPAQDNGADWALMRPLLSDPRIKPAPAQIAWMRAAFRDLLRIRRSSTLFRLRTAADVRARLRFLNTGSRQEPTVLAAVLDGRGYDGAGFQSLAYFINVDTRAHTLALTEAVAVDYELHPIHRAADVADPRPSQSAHFDRATGQFTIPPRSAVVFVVE